MNDFPVFKGKLPAITIKQMEEVDWLMINDYRISLVQMMENAGRGLARLAIRKFLGPERGQEVAVLAGSGGNGGGALVCARRLHNMGAKVKVYLSRSYREMDKVPLQQLRILDRMGVSFETPTALPEPGETALIIDGLIGYSLQGAPRGLAGEMIEWANAQPLPTLALDTPSGLDLTSGQSHTPTIEAASTLTLALPKQGLLLPEVADKVGQLYLADISVPPDLYRKLSLKVPVLAEMFTESDIVQLRKPESEVIV